VTKIIKEARIAVPAITTAFFFENKKPASMLTHAIKTTAS
jgi:hypothetical protein